MSISIATKILITLGAILGMILILVGVHHYVSILATHISKNERDMDDSNIFLFRKQVEKNPEVISDFNLFGRFFEKDNRPMRKDSHQPVNMVYSKRDLN